MKITIPFIQRTHGALKGRPYADLSVIPEGATITDVTIKFEIPPPAPAKEAHS